jgi:hypothetical protein
MYKYSIDRVKKSALFLFLKICERPNTIVVYSLAVIKGNIHVWKKKQDLKDGLYQENGLKSSTEQG